MVKRYAVLVLHEVIVYNQTKKGAKLVAVKGYTNAKCVSIRRLPNIEDEPCKPIIDNRTAPGS
jgi:hypothetical protein